MRLHETKLKIWVAAIAFAASWPVAFITVASLDIAPPRDEIEGRTDKPAYRPGETVTGRWEMLYKRACDDFAVRWLTTSANPYQIDYLPTEGLRPVILPQRLLPKRVRVDFAGFTVPTGFPPGPAQYHIRDEFACNWLQRLAPSLFAITVDRPVVEFEVLPADPARPAGGR